MTRRPVLRALATVALVGSGLAPAGPAGAVEPGSAAAVQAFADQVIPDRLARYEIPGAAVVVVSGGEQVFAGGYGMADLASGTPVTADQSVFPLDSVAKLLTATAVMQLVEDGRVGLDADVNTYLAGFAIPDTYPGRPVTLTHLLTHTAGFEDRPIGILTTDPAATVPLAEYLAAHQPARVRPPGELVAYSNYGLALAGLVVEQQTGVPFAQYLDAYVFAPLGMADSTFGQPPPEPLAGRVVTRYRPAGDRQEPLGTYGENLSPAGGAVATVTDVGRFMRAQLAGGRLDTGQVLTEAAVTTMQERHFTHHPRLAGMALGFHERHHGATRLLEHGGDGPGSHGLLAILPEPGDGIYVVFNGDGIGGGGPAAAREVIDEFVARFHPADGLVATGDEPAMPDGAAPDRWSGTYRTSRISHHDFTSLAVFFHTVRVEVVAGELRTTGLPPEAAEARRWERIGPDLFRERNGSTLIAFDGSGGQPTALFDGPASYERLAWHQLPQLHLAVGAVGLALLLSCLGWLWRVVRPGRDRPAAPRAATVARWLAGATTGLVIGFMAALAAVFAGDLEEAVVTGSAGLRVAFLLVQAAALLGVAVVGCAVLAWWRGWWSRRSRVHYSLVAAGAVLLFGVFQTYHFLLTPLG